MRSRVGLAKKLLAAAVLVASCGATIAFARSPGPRAPAAPALRAVGPSTAPRARRIAVIVMENRAFDQVIGNPRAPYVNRLARRYALATRYYAVAHPSLPNYIALTGGSTYEIHSDCRACDVSASNLVNQLDTAGLSWRAFFQSLPHAGFLGGMTQNLHSASVTYARAYNPFVYFDRVTQRRVDTRRLVPLGGLRHDLADGRLPRFTWIALDLRRDGHNGSLARADLALSRVVPGVLRALGPRGLLFLTWDEGQGNAGLGGTRGGGRVPLIVAGGGAARHAIVAAPANHYPLLATIERLFGLRRLARAGAADAGALAGALRTPLPTDTTGTPPL
jgi:acid phosphatase